MSGGLEVYVDWDGRTWTVGGELVSFTDALDLYENTAYTPRRLSVSVHRRGPSNDPRASGRAHHDHP